ncbi:bro-j [Cyclophragma undans nucleopolyhedrovirus]|uniref:Bro-j n=1 Tax=Cyclophragma undans nucleopolyhedrovirus TaxID=1906244 RepID=A0A288QW47_9ABAC|nr:bro-j [Cyclophragma undans nucleopolyhedrovirus]AOT85599.1 bro-j [Cyclophragma undans nucleopolyhedrovirus]
MAQVKIGQFKFGDDTFNLRYIVDNEEVKFVAKDVASGLKYQDTKKAIKIHVDDKYIFNFNQGGQNAPPSHNALVKRGDPLYLQPHTVLINKSGVIQLIMKSKLPYAVELQAWLLEEVIPQVLCTGKYSPAIQEQQEENKQLVNKLIKIFTEQVSALQVALLQKTEQLVKKQEFIERIIATKDRQIEDKDQQVSRVMTDLNRMYNGFQDTMQKKDRQVSELVNKLMDLSERAVQYPADERKHPVLCVARDGTTFTAIAGQRTYVQTQKHKLNIGSDDIVLETKRPNPTVDWNNATYQVNAAKRSKRSISFESRDDAQQFEDRIKYLLNNKQMK